MGQLEFSIAGSLARERTQRDDPARAAKALIITAIAALFLLPRTQVETGGLVASTTGVDFGTISAGGSQERLITVSARGASPGAATTTVSGDRFTLVESDCAELTKDASCSVRVRFSPSEASTTYEGSVDVRSENAGSVTVALRGATDGRGSTVAGPPVVDPAVVRPPVVSASPGEFDFKAVDVDKMSEHQIKISATGDAPAGRIKATVTGGAFALDDAGCREDLAQNHSCTVTVTFTPSEAVSYRGQLSIHSAHANAVNVALRGTGRAAGPVKVSILPKPGPFSPQPVGTTSGQFQLTVTNRSSRKIVLAYGDETGSGPFRITGLCSGTTLDRQQSCTETATFAPMSTGDFVGSRDILVDGIVVDSYQLTGRGVAAELSVPDQVVFEGETTSREVTITNRGSADLIISRTNIEVSRNSTFQRPPTACISHIPPGATCSVPVTIRGGMRQAVQQGSLSIIGNDAGSPHQVALRAEIYAPELAADFSSIVFETPRSPIAIHIVNRGNAPTGRISSFVTNNAFAIVQNGCVAGIGAGDSCDIAVRFSGQGNGTITGVLTLSAANGPALSISLQGQGLTPAPAPAPAPEPAPVR
ncbi:MAG TPA: choice-of-anchor D domain-containing protein [Steroidobacteraceae bacterium]|nr:choice-of-anchor D domain-containing protein [Steroidobacteraceae bacterium]